MYWLMFAINAALIVVAGVKLTYYAERFSDEFNIGKVWLGIVLLGLVTSLPEAISSLSAVVSLHAYDLAIANLLGSNNFNPMLLVVMDVVYRKGVLTNNIVLDNSNIISGFFVIVLELLVIAGILVPGVFSHPVIGRFSLSTVLIFVIFLSGMKLLYSFNNDGVSDGDGNETHSMHCRAGIIAGLFASAIVVIFAAIWLAASAEVIADKTGLGRTFVGSIFLACVTSLPEMVVSLSALRMGALGMAAGNIFGSNMINIFILAVCDIVHHGMPILSVVSKINALTACLGGVLVFVAMAGMLFNKKKAYFGVGIDSVIMTILFFIGTAVLYALR